MRILLVEDDSLTLDLWEEWLRQHGHEIVKCPDSDTALAELTHCKPDAIVMDYFLAGPTGIDTMRVMRCLECGTGVPVVVLTAAAGDELKTAVETVSLLPPACVCRKPIAGEELIAAIESLKAKPC